MSSASSERTSASTDVEILEARVKALEEALVLTGTIVAHSGEKPPSDQWLLCDGSEVPEGPRYGPLVALLRTHFDPAREKIRVPDLRGRAIVGMGTGMGSGDNLTPRVLGTAFGTERHVLNNANLPSHTHQLTDHGHTHQASVSDPGHVHGVTDNGHVHDVKDDGHGHVFHPGRGWIDDEWVRVVSDHGKVKFDRNDGGFDMPDKGACIEKSKTGVEIKRTSTGVAIQNSRSGVSVNLATSNTGISISSTGDSEPFEISQPSLVLNFIIHI